MNKNRCFLIAAGVIGFLALVALGGCFGGKMRPGEGDYWWDDREHKKLNSYELPPEPAAPPTDEMKAAPPEPEAPAEEASPEPRVNPRKKSSAGAFPKGHTGQ
jgi:hypothetical protein